MGTSDAPVAILWLFYFLIIHRLAAIGKEFSSLRSRLSEQNQRLSESLERIQQLASHDDLTGALNRRAFRELLAAERMRQAVQSHDGNRIAPGLTLTMSAGVAEFNPEENIEGLIARADKALYAAKAGGRNRTLAG
ncbi:MAG TPA: diguanylate cyclase [Burkholderiaceae bacterium]|nr:diguanylate cyclase [Burkholderiaceae bacterium]